MAAAAGLVAWVAAANRDVGLSPVPSRLDETGLVRIARQGTPGELVITTMHGRSPSTALLQRIRSGEVVGVLLRGENIASKTQVIRLTRALQDAAVGTGTGLPLLIAVDQEGGDVRRFGFLPPAASARDMAQWTTARIRRVGRATGRALRALGVNVDLAPVADVPNTRDNFLGSRAFSSQRSQVLRASCAFARGLRDGGVMPTLKHFPGLGGAGPRNTDRTVTRIGMTVPRLRRDAVAYSRCGSEPGTLAMVSNAIYPKLTGRRPAVLAAATYAFARRLGERGPFVTDSLDAAGLAGQRAVATRAVIAGANLLLYTVPGSAAAGYRELVSAQTRGVIDDALLAARAAPVRELRASIRAAGP